MNETITISTEGLPSRASLEAEVSRASNPREYRDLYQRVEAALPEPWPTAPGSTASRSLYTGEVEWAHLIDDGVCWVTDSGDGFDERQMRERDFTPRHDAGADQ